MAEPARRQTAAEEAPPYDPTGDRAHARRAARSARGARRAQAGGPARAHPLLHRHPRAPRRGRRARVLRLAGRWRSSSGSDAGTGRPLRLPRAALPSAAARSPTRARPRAIWTAGGRIAWVAGLVLMLSSFMGWYVGSGEGLTISVIGWHTGDARQARLLPRRRRHSPRSPARGRDRASARDSGEPGHNRDRRGLDDLRPDSADLDPRPVPAGRRPWNRDLDRARGSDRRHLRRAASSRRRAMTIPPTSRPSIAPPSTSSG